MISLGRILSDPPGDVCITVEHAADDDDVGGRTGPEG